MSPNSRGIRAQAIVRVIPGGGTRNAAQIGTQWNYVTRDGELDLERSDRYFEDAAPIRPDEIEELSKAWETHAAVHPGLIKPDGSRRDITTHIVVSLPRAANEDLPTAKATLREFAFEMFGSGRNGGQWDYVTAFHTDRDHPHLHIVVSRMSHEGRWLKIARRDPFMNYDNMRAVMSDVAERRGYNLDSTTRAERGIIERPVTSAEHRRRSRQRVAVYPQPIPDPPPRDALLLRANPSLRNQAENAARAAIEGAATRYRAREVAAAAAAEARRQHEAVAAAEAAAAADNGEFDGGDDNHNIDQLPAGARRRRQRRQARINQSNVETRAQRARREAQEASRIRLDIENRRKAKIARRQERGHQGPNVETRAARREREQMERMQLRSGRTVNRNELGQGAGLHTAGRQDQRDDRNDRQR